MIKRTSAILLLIAANIIILVHAVVPHHNHHGEFCIEDTYSHSNNSCQNHCESNHSHEQKNDNSSECCSLKQLLVVPVNHFISNQKYLICKDHDYSPGVYSVLISIKLTHHFYISSLKRSHCYLHSLYNQDVNQNHDLRGPPNV